MPWGHTPVKGKWRYSRPMGGAASTRTWRVRGTSRGSTRARNVPLLTAVVATAVALGLLAIHVHVRSVPGLAALEGLTIDARFRARGERVPSTDRITIVGLDDRTRAADPDIFVSRARWAAFLAKLASYRPKIIALDLFFAAPEVVLPADLAKHVVELDAEPAPAAASDPQLVEARALIHEVADALHGDDRLGDAITAAHSVYLGAAFEAGDATTARAPATLDLAAIGQVGDNQAGGDARPLIAAAVAATTPTIAKGAVGAGAINVLRDDDGVTRTIPLAIAYGGRYYTSLGLSVALAEMGRARDTAYVVGAPELRAGGRSLPLGPSASASLDLLGRSAFPRVSAADIMAGTADREALAGKLVFVGFTYSEFDKVATPFDSTADGVELHATLAENILGDRLLDRTGAWTTALATAALCALVVLAQVRRLRRRAWVPPLVAIAAIAGYIAIAQALFTRGTIIAVGAPCLLAALVLLAATIGGLATEGREKALLRATFSRYVSGDVVDQLVADPSLARLGGQRRELTVLFSDIRSFSKLAEKMEPEALAALLGEYLTPMTDLVLASGGTLDKYIGDAVMAMWSAPLALPDHAARACEVALRMQEELAALNVRWAAAGKPTMRDRRRARTPARWSSATWARPRASITR